ncbi:MAG TPA: HEAT repeat domain-containing protein [Kofleriaceae bacterium]|nr:HEAT repeat domain-containing protein [Kofleriaceae bacterium]
MTSRALAVAAACLLGLYGRAAADTLEINVRELGSSDAPYKVRLSAALSLSKSHDARAVIALADALVRDDEPTIRRVSALALEKLVDSHIADDARELALDALDKAAANDSDQRVRDTAARIAKELSGLRRRKDTPPPSDKPPVFINIGTTQDQSKKLPNDGADRLTRVVKKNVERTGYATTWPGGLPTSAELGKSRAFIVASTVKMVEITKAGRKTEIACTVEIRVATWSGKDGGERWEANKAASASGSAKATTGNADRDVAGGVRDCVEAVAEDITARQVVPFLRRLATM